MRPTLLLMMTALPTVQSPFRKGFPYDTISSNKEWCLKGAKGVQEEVEDGASMILDTGCTKAMCSRHAYLLMRQGLSEGQVEQLPDSSTFNFANGQKTLAREKCRIWFSYEPPLFTDFSIIDEGKVPFLISPPQMKNLGVALDLRGTPERILFHIGLLKGQGVPLHRNRAGHLTLDVIEICKKAKASAHKGRQLHAASSFPATADEPSEIPLAECTATDSRRFHRQLQRRGIAYLLGRKCHQHSCTNVQIKEPP